MDLYISHVNDLNCADVLEVGFCMLFGLILPI